MQALRQYNMKTNEFLQRSAYLEAIETLTKEEEELKLQIKALEMGKQALNRLMNENTATEQGVPPDRPRHSEGVVTESQRPIVKPIARSSKGGKKVVIPTAYNKDGSYKDKALYILNVLGEAFTTDVIDYILDQEPELDADLVKLNIGKALPRLVEQDIVILEKGTKAGNSNRYRLK